MNIEGPRLIYNSQGDGRFVVPGLCKVLQGPSLFDLDSLFPPIGAQVAYSNPDSKQYVEELQGKHP